MPFLNLFRPLHPFGLAQGTYYCRAIAFWGIGCLFCACENSLQEVGQVAEQSRTAVESIRNTRITYSENAQVSLVLQAPLVLRHKEKDPYTEFPEGLTVTFYNPDQTVSGVLTADYATRSETKGETFIRKNVVWKNAKRNETLETEELEWNEKNKKITSNTFVKIITDSESIFGEGFEANQDFSRYRIRKITGTLKNAGI